MASKEVEVLRAACCIAGLDRKITPGELKVLRALADRIGVGEMSLNAMIERATSDPDYFQEMFTVLKHAPEETMKTMVLVAMADGVLVEEERVVLQHFSSLLELDQARFDALLAEAEEYCKKRAAARAKGDAAAE
jgi:tellurite resistance protein